MDDASAFISTLFASDFRYYLLREPENNTFSIVVRNHPCGVEGVVCFKEAVVRAYGMTFHFNDIPKLKVDNMTVYTDPSGPVEVASDIYYSTAGLFYALYFAKLGLIVLHDGGKYALYLQPISSFQ